MDRALILARAGDISFFFVSLTNYQHTLSGNLISVIAESRRRTKQIGSSKRMFSIPGGILRPKRTICTT
ncbi:hypothetical protein AYI69_g3592 [Smittium culicis]|uniref:Uncharacterized protein n=1 Tax=Smittium culicis TaxID=133412 RepID=A0A1R1YJ99_9FUNG|nr:hypothetical protein AYI69_g3592 [Smittium culicis]